MEFEDGCYEVAKILYNGKDKRHISEIVEEDKEQLIKYKAFREIAYTYNWEYIFKISREDIDYDIMNYCMTNNYYKSAIKILNDSNLFIEWHTEIGVSAIERNNLKFFKIIMEQMGEISFTELDFRYSKSIEILDKNKEFFNYFKNIIINNGYKVYNGHKGSYKDTFIINNLNNVKIHIRYLEYLGVI